MTNGSFSGRCEATLSVHTKLFRCETLACAALRLVMFEMLSVAMAASLPLIPPLQFSGKCINVTAVWPQFTGFALDVSTSLVNTPQR